MHFYYIIDTNRVLLLQVPIPVAVIHVVKLLGRPLYSAADPGVTTGPTREELEVRSRFVLVTLEAVIEASVRFVVWFPRDPAQDTETPALLPGLQDVELPDGDAGHGEPQPDEAVPHESVGHDTEGPAGPDGLGEVLLEVDPEVLEVGAGSAVTGVGHHKALGLALGQVGEVPGCHSLT